MAFWTDSGTQNLQLDYTITDVTTQTFEYTNDFLNCQIDRLIEELIPGTGWISPPSILSLVKIQDDPVTGKSIYDLKITTTATDLVDDPGGAGSIPPMRQFRVQIVSLSDPTLVYESLLVDVTFKHPCRSIELVEKDITNV